jgi:hypothetical protein
MSKIRYSNWEEMLEAGFNPEPQHGDVVKWSSNGLMWSVEYNDDLNESTSTSKPDWEHDVIFLERRGRSL